MFPARPSPVYAAETPLAELRTAELFVTTTLRLWVLPHTKPEGDHPEWWQGFLRLGVDAGGMAGFDTLLRLVATSARRTLDVRCPRCAKLGADEAWLLQMLSLLQRGQEAQAMAILADWLPPAGARIALAPAESLAAALTQAGLSLPHRHAEAATIHRLTPAGHAIRGLTLVH